MPHHRSLTVEGALMLTPRKIETFCRWWSLQIKRPVDSATFFGHAYYWKYKKVDEKAMLFAYIAYQRSGYIPEYVHEYWKYRVLTYIVIEGGPNDKTNLLAPPSKV